MQKALTVAVILSATNRMTAVVDNAVNASIRKIEQLAKRTEQLSQRAMNLGRDAVGVGLGIGAAFAYPIKSAMEFETGMAGIRKVVGELKDEKAFAQFSDEVLKLGRELPLAYDQITDLVAAGGRMDIPKDKLIEYTKNVAKMSVAFDMAAGEIGEQMGKLSVAFKIPIQDISKLGDTINYLDDNSIAKGADIINVLQRMAGTAQQVGMSADQAAALASTFLTLGSSAEVAGTASQAMLRELSIATMQGGKFQSALGELGLNAQELQKNMTLDPQNTLLGVLDRLNKIKPEKQIEITTKLFGKEYGDDAAKLAKGVEEYRRQIGLLNNTELKGSMSKEFDVRMKTSAAQATLFKNSLTEIAITIGNAILPALNSVLNAVRPSIQAFGEWAKRNPELIETIAKVAAVIAGVSLAAGALSIVFGGVMKTVTLAISSFGGLVKAVRFVGVAVRTLSALMVANPIGAAVLAIATAVYLIYEYWEPIKQFFANLWQGVKNVFWGVVGWFQSLPQKFYDIGVSIAESLWEGIKSLAQQIWDTITAPFRWAAEMTGVNAVQQQAQKLAEADAAKKLQGTGVGVGQVKSMTGDQLTRITKGESPTAVLGQGSKAPVGGNTLNYQPTINVQGKMEDSDKVSLYQQLEDQRRKFERMMEETQRQKERKQF